MRDTGLSPLSSLYEKIWFLQPILLLLSIFEPKKNAASRLSFLGSIQKHSSVRLAIMICPRCSKLRGTRKGWRNSQWDASSPTMYPYDGCRQCHDSGPSQQRVQDLIVIRDLLAHDIADFQEGQADFLWTMKQMYTSDYIEGSSKDQATFFRTMKKKLRNFGDWKSLNYNGGLPAVYEFHPKHWKDYMRDWYFDPSNYVYAKAIRLACPSFIDTSGFTNEETLGDCIEAVLGLECALMSQSETDETYHLLFTPWPQSGISVASAAHFWRIISTHLFYIEWVEELLREARSLWRYRNWQCFWESVQLQSESRAWLDMYSTECGKTANSLQFFFCFCPHCLNRKPSLPFL